MPAPPHVHPRSPGRKRAKPGPRGTEYRRLFRQGNSLGLTLPPACVRLLGGSKTKTVQALPMPSGKVIIAPVNVRVGAERELVSAVRDVAVLRRQLGRYKRRLQARPVKLWNEAFNQGALHAHGQRFLDLDAFHETVRELVALL